MLLHRSQALSRDTRRRRLVLVADPPVARQVYAATIASTRAHNAARSRQHSGGKGPTKNIKTPPISADRPQHRPHHDPAEASEHILQVSDTDSFTCPCQLNPPL